MRTLFTRFSLIVAMLVLCLASMASTTIYRFRVVDDSGTPVPGCTFVQGTTKSFNSVNLGTNVTQVLNPTDMLDGNYAVSYDPETTNGEILVTWAVTKPGGWSGTITLQNASISLALTRDSSRILNADVLSSTLATAANLATAQMAISALPSAATTAAAVWGVGTRTLTAFAFTPNVGNITGSVPNVTIAGYASGQDPATLVLDAAASGHNTSLSVGAKINAAGSASDPLANLLSTYSTPGTGGYVLGHNLDAAVSSRMASGNVTVGGYATGQDPATLLKTATFNGHTFVDLMTIIGFNPAGTITSITKSTSSPWTMTTVYADGGATATYVSTFSNNTFTVQIGRPTVTFTGLP